MLTTAIGVCLGLFGFCAMHALWRRLTTCRELRRLVRGWERAVARDEPQSIRAPQKPARWIEPFPLILAGWGLGCLILALGAAIY
jgi:hypothetical protein